MAEALGVGYTPRGMKAYIAVRLPTGEQTAYIGMTEEKLPNEFHLPTATA